MGFFCLMIMELLMGFMFNDKEAPNGIFQFNDKGAPNGFTGYSFPAL